MFNSKLRFSYMISSNLGCRITKSSFLSNFYWFPDLFLSASSLPTNAPHNPNPTPKLFVYNVSITLFVLFFFLWRVFFTYMVIVMPMSTVNSDRTKPFESWIFFRHGSEVLNHVANIFQPEYAEQVPPCTWEGGGDNGGLCLYAHMHVCRFRNLDF